MNLHTTTLYRPVGPKELELIAASGWTAFPPRLPEQPIFYPVVLRQYAVQIARDWNVSRDGAGFVTQFEVRQSYVNQFEIHTVGSAEHQEYWIPAEQLDDFNRNIVGSIQVVEEFHTAL